jgi:tetratricopeptide (TPR) repeat protein
MRYILAILLLGALCFSKTDQSKAISQRIHKKLTAIETMINDRHYKEADAKLQAMLAEPPARAIDRAYLYYTAGILHLDQRHFNKAKQYFIMAYDQNAFAEKGTLTILQMIGSLSMRKRDFKSAVKYYNAYIRLNPNPKKSIYKSLARAHYRLKEYDRAIAVLQEAVKKLSADESLYNTLFSYQYESGHLSSAASTLEQMLRLWPQRQKYYMQLASVYQQLKLPGQALQVMQLCFAQGLLKKENDILQYASMLYEAGIPYKAASVLSHSLQGGAVKKNRKNYELLAAFYREAREYSLQINALKKAASYTTDGENELYFAQLCYEKDDFACMVKYADKAVKKGVGHKGEAYLLMALGHYGLKNEKEAKSCFTKASEFKATKKSSLQYLKMLK